MKQKHLNKYINKKMRNYKRENLIINEIKMKFRYKRSENKILTQKLSYMDGVKVQVFHMFYIFIL